MNSAKWRSLASLTSKVDTLSDLIPFDDFLKALWDYVGIQRGKDEEDNSKLSRAQIDDKVNKWIEAFIMDKRPKVEGFVKDNGELELQRLFNVLSAIMTGYDVIQPLIEDPSITEIQINDYNSIWAESGGKIRLATDPITHKPISFRSPESCLYFMNNLLQITNSQIDDGKHNAIGNAITVEGYRVAAVGPGAMAADKGRAYSAKRSPACTIRKFSEKVISVDDLRRWQSESDQMADFISLLGDNHASVAVAGETGSGKTVNLQTVIDSITDSTRVISMEKDSELRLRRFDSEGKLINNVLQFEYSTDPNNTSTTSNTPTNLFNQCMRLTPRTIVFGEIRSNEEIGLAMTAAEAGHNIMFTVHAGDPNSTIERLTNALLKNNPGQQKADVMSSICNALDIIIIPAQMKDGSRKVLEIAEVKGCEVRDGIIRPVINTLYEFRQTGYVVDKKTGKGKVYGEHVQVNNISPELLNKWSRKGMEPEVREFLTMPLTADNRIGTYFEKYSENRYPPGYRGPKEEPIGSIRYANMVNKDNIEQETEQAISNMRKFEKKRSMTSAQNDTPKYSNEDIDAILNGIGGGT